MTHGRIFLATLVLLVLLAFFYRRSRSQVASDLSKALPTSQSSSNPSSFFVRFTNAIAARNFSDSNVVYLRNLLIEASASGATNDTAFSWAMSQTDVTNLHNTNIPPDVRNRLFSTALNALGFSGRDEALTRYQQLTNIPSSQIRPFSGGVVQGVFNLDTIKKYGRDKALNEVLASPDSSFEEFVKWRASSNAHAWVLWSMQMSARNN